MSQLPICSLGDVNNSNEIVLEKRVKRKAHFMVLEANKTVFAWQKL